MLYRLFLPLPCSWYHLVHKSTPDNLHCPLAHLRHKVVVDDHCLNFNSSYWTHFVGPFVMFNSFCRFVGLFDIFKPLLWH